MVTTVLTMPNPTRSSRRRSFRDVVVMPTETFHDGSMFKGGPLWPRYAFQWGARHARGRFPFPRDARPTAIARPEVVLETGTWCGPIAYHFGHAVADFGMRLAMSGHADRSQPLLFSIQQREDFQPPDFFWQMLDHLEIERTRVVLVRRPTLVRELHVFPQAERRGGPGPGADHLDFMDRLLTRPASPGPRDAVFVSRSHLAARYDFPTGHIAGERYLEELFGRAGLATMYPEEISLSEQLDRYRGARLIVFSEGSAVHALQLLGRLDARIVIIARRPGSRLAAEALRPRARALTYIQALRGLIYGRNSSGRPYPGRGISVLKPEILLDQLSAVGIDLRPFWDARRYATERDADIAAWCELTNARELHPRSRELILRRLRVLSIEIAR